MKLFIALCISGIVIYFAYGYFNKRLYYILLSLLYRENKPQEFLDKLDTTYAKLMFNKNIRLLMSIDAYLTLDRKEELDQVFATLNKASIKKTDKYLVYQKEVIFYADHHEEEKARAAFAAMQELLAGFNKNREKYENLYDECKYVVAIKLDKDGQYAEELSKKARETTLDVAKGMYFFKASQSYLLRGENKMCKNRLEDAYGYLKDTNYGPIIDEIMTKGEYEKILDLSI